MKAAVNGGFLFFQIDYIYVTKRHFVRENKKCVFSYWKIDYLYSDDEMIVPINNKNKG